jgi:twitching motility two-component system response regulator PilH
MAKRILVVEDSPAEMKKIQLALGNRGYEILTADDGETALQLATTNLPDVVVLDVVLPKKNGFQVCRQLKATPITSKIKIIMLSGKNQESDKYWGFKQGADDYLTKPFEPAQLISSVERYL